MNSLTNSFGVSGTYNVLHIISAHLILSGISLPQNRWRIDLFQKQIKDMLVQILA